MPYMIDEASLPLELPEVAKFLPTETGEPPLGHATKWAWDTVNKCVVENEKIDHVTVFPLELNTMRDSPVLRLTISATWTRIIIRH